MAIAKSIEISSDSTQSFDQAVKDGVARCGKTVKNIKEAWVKEQKVTVENGQVTNYRVHMMITFVVND